MKKQYYKFMNGEYELSTRRDILVTHTDLDGAGCAVVGLLNGIREIYYCNNGSDINNTVTDLIDEYNRGFYEMFNIIIADNSVSDEVAETLDKLYGNDNFGLTLLDHHASAEHLNKYDWATIDTEECGTTLMYYECGDYKHNTDDLKKFCNDVKDRDLWLWEQNGNEYANIHNEYLHMLGIEKYVAAIASNILDGKLIINKADENKVRKKLAEKDAYVQSNVNNYFKKKIHIGSKLTPQYATEYEVAFTFASRYVSELGNAICKEHNDIDICAIVCANRGTVELRAVKDNVDLSVIAKKLGGGGHKRAAGFPLSTDFINSIINSFAKMMSIDDTTEA